MNIDHASNDPSNYDQTAHRYLSNNQAAINPQKKLQTGAKRGPVGPNLTSKPWLDKIEPRKESFEVINPEKMVIFLLFFFKT